MRTSKNWVLVSLLIMVCYQYPVLGLDNCPDGAVENELCDNGRGYCAYASELPNGANGQGSANLKCFPGKPCGELSLQQHGFLKPIDISDITLGAKAALLCCEGYYTDTPVELTCDVNQEWSGPNDTCLPVDCGPVPPTGMTFAYLQASTFPNFAILECGVGFEPLDASVAASVATCGADGQWHTMLACVLTESGSISYVFGFPSNRHYYLNSDLSVFVFSSVETTVILEAPLGGFSATATFNGAVELIIPKALRTWQNIIGVMNRGFVLTSTNPIDAYIEDPHSDSCEGTVLIPEEDLSQEYVIATWRQTFSAVIAVVGTVDGTLITIILTDSTVVSAIIDRYEMYQYLAVSDITGARVSANQNVAVFAGSQCTYVGANACDYLLESVPGIQLLKQKYIAWFPHPRKRYVLRIVGLEDGTTVEITGESAVSVNAGGKITRHKDDQIVAVIADKKVLVALYAKGRNDEPSASDYHDPAMLYAPGYQGYRTIYRFMVPSTANSATLTVIIPTDPVAIASIALDGVPVTPDLTREVTVPGVGGYTVVYKDVATGEHTVTASTAFLGSLSFFRFWGETWLNLPYLV